MVVCSQKSNTSALTYIGQAIDSKSAFESILQFQIQDQTTASKYQGMSERQTGRPWYENCNAVIIVGTCGGGLNLVIVSTCGGK